MKLRARTLVTLLAAVVQAVGCRPDPQPVAEPPVELASASASALAAPPASAIVHEPGSLPSARPAPSAKPAPAPAMAPVFARLTAAAKSRKTNLASSGVTFLARTGLVAITGERGVAVVDVAKGTGFAITTGASVGAFLLSPDESLAVVSDGSGRTTLWDARAGTLRATWPGESYTLALSPDGTRLASADPGGNGARVREVATGAEVRKVAGSAIFDAVFSNQGKELVTSSNNVILTAFDVATGKELAQHGSGTTATFGLAVSPDGRLGAAGSPAGHGLEVFEVRVPGSRQLVTVGSCQEHVSPRFSGNGRLVFAYGGSRWVKTFETGTWKPYASYHATATQWIHSAADDLSRVVVATEEQTAPAVVTVETKVETKLQRPFEQGTSYAISPDGQYVAASLGGVARVWSAKSGALVYEEAGATAAPAPR